MRNLSISNRTRAREDELDNLLEYWEQDLKGGRLSIEHQSEIRLWLEKNGYDWVREAMKEASDANGRYLNFKLLKGVVGRKMKGGVKSGGSDSVAPSPKPERDKLADPKPWDKYAPAL